MILTFVFFVNAFFGAIEGALIDEGVRRPAGDREEGIWLLREESGLDG